MTSSETPPEESMSPELEAQQAEASATDLQATGGAEIVPPDAGPPDLPSMPVLEHLRELRRRLTIAVVSVLAGMLLSLVAAFSIRDGLLEMCTVCSFEFHRPTENVVTYFRVALIMGLTLASPIVLYQAVAYILPALHRHERRYLFLSLPGAGLLFALGLLFGYYIVLDRSINFLATWGAGGDFGNAVAEPNWNVALYISFVTNLLLIIGLAFQTPLVVYLLSKIGILKPHTMRKYRRHAFLLFAVLAAVLTPTPDPFTMFLVMAPMYVLYELGGLLARWF